MDEQLDALKQIVKSIQYLVNQSKLETTKIYSGFVLSDEGGGKYKVKVNDIEKVLPLYGTNTIAVNNTVKVFVPQGNYNLAFIM